MLALALASVVEQAMGGSSGAVSKINAISDGYAEFSVKPSYAKPFMFFSYIVYFCRLLLGLYKKTLAQLDTKKL